jgi:hypothetical protein
MTQVWDNKASLLLLHALTALIAPAHRTDLSSLFAAAAALLAAGCCYGALSPLKSQNLAPTHHSPLVLSLGDFDKKIAYLKNFDECWNKSSVPSGEPPASYKTLIQLSFHLQPYKVVF